MTFLFSLLDVVLTTIMLFDTLGLAYLIRTQGPEKCEKKEYIRVCLSWILFLTICSIFTCNKKGLFGTLLRICFFLAKAYVTLPICKGTLKIYDYLIEKGNAEKWYYQIVGPLKDKVCKGSQPPVSNVISETVEPITPQ